MVMEFVVEVWDTNFQLSFITILHNFIKTDFICYYTVHLMNLLAYRCRCVEGSFTLAQCSYGVDTRSLL